MALDDIAAPAAPVIAVVGAGPAGFYAAEALLQALPDARVHLFERTAAPHGLVRYGVAPDHQKLKQVAAVFEDIASHPRVRLHAGVDIGRDLDIAQLHARSHAVVLTHGAALGRSLGVPGESLAQVWSSASFVGWYNGHADHAGAAPDLAVDDAVIVGNGNVALDVARLLARDFDDLAATDIPQAMLAHFRRRGIRQVHLLGRGAPGRVKFTFREFRQLADLPGVRIRLPQAGQFTEATWSEAATPDAARTLAWLRADQARPHDAKDDGVTVNLWFDLTPTAFVGEPALRAVRVRPAAGEPFELPCGIAVTCVGYACRPIGGGPGLGPAGTLRHRAGQVLDEEGHEIDGLFVAGWAKRGPSGIVGTNRACAGETVATLAAAWPALRDRTLAGDIDALLRSRGIDPLDDADWKLLDAHEKARGAALGKPREKLLSMAQAREALARLRAA
jgi:NADPH-dependent glutamate synthase beta subunit-like oxidoreductase